MGDPNWWLVAFTFFAVALSGIGLVLSVQSKRQTETLKNISKDVELMINRSQANLLDRLSERFVEDKVHKLELELLKQKGADLDHRTTRNTEHITILLNFMAAKAQTQPAIASGDRLA